MDETTKTKSDVPGLFDFVDAIGSSKKDILTSIEAERAFSPWMIGVAFSQHIDSIFLANMANEIYHAPKTAIYDFLLHTIAPKKRYGKWAKKTQIDESLIEIACKVFKWSKRRAPELIGILDKDQIQHLATRLEKGGT